MRSFLRVFFLKSKFRRASILGISVKTVGFIARLEKKVSFIWSLKLHGHHPGVVYRVGRRVGPGREPFFVRNSRTPLLSWRKFDRRHLVDDDDDRLSKKKLAS